MLVESRIPMYRLQYLYRDLTNFTFLGKESQGNLTDAIEQFSVLSFF